jgi:hypothetical protein
VAEELYYFVCETHGISFYEDDPRPAHEISALMGRANRWADKLGMEDCNYQLRIAEQHRDPEWGVDWEKVKKSHE